MKLQEQLEEVCNGLATRLQEYKSENAQLEELLVAEANMESLMRNRELTETRMMQALREELASAERRAEEERAAHNATKKASMEREVELEHRALEASTALARTQRTKRSKSKSNQMKNMSSAIILVLLVLHGVTTTAGHPFGTKVRVEIANMLPDAQQLRIHCQSKDDDLGLQVVEPKQKYGFEFRVNFFSSTLFYCDASWRGGELKFDIFDAHADRRRCFHHCEWEARGDAIVGYTESGRSKTDIVLPWRVY